MSNYIEDIFPVFYDSINRFDPNMKQAAQHFNRMCMSNTQFTEKQATYLISIMRAHMNQISIDISSVLNYPKWKKPFRYIDTSKRIWVTDTKVCVQSPFSVKALVEEEFGQDLINWDPELRVKVGNLFEMNIIHLYDFATTHGFETCETFEAAVNMAEEVIHLPECVPHSLIIDGAVHLVNAEPSTDEWFEEHRYNNLTDIIIAKNMGYPYVGPVNTLVEKIAATETNLFWTNDIDKFISLCEEIPGNICIILDRVSNVQSWICDFMEAIESSSIDHSEISYCAHVKDRGIKSIIQEYSISSNKNARIRIFIHTIPKWLTEELESINMIVTNNIYKAVIQSTRTLLDSHPCVLTFSEYQPANSPGETPFVNL